jgi:heavy metal sensor kinase
VNVRTLRFKFGITNGLFISIFFVLFGYARYQTFAYRAERSFEQGIKNQANFFLRNIEPTADDFAWKKDVPDAEVWSLETIRPYFVLTDVNGRVLREEIYGSYILRMLANKDLDHVLHNRSGFSDAVTSDGTTRFRFLSQEIRSEKGPTLVLHLGRSLRQVTDVLDEYMRIYLWSVPFVLVVAGAVGWFLAVHALKPFDDVARTAEQITLENLNTQIENARKEQEVQRLVQAFNTMVGRLRQSFDQMRRFNANVAHELRTPLAILQGENEIALRSESVPEEIRAVLISNLEELGRLTRLVNDLMTLSEAEAGGRVLVRKPLNLKPLIGDLAEQIQLLAMERNIRITCQELPDVMVEGDDLWLRRAILNLLDNAIKYSRDGGQIRISMAPEKNRAHISIRDEGIGISREDLPHIFDRLFRTDPARNRTTGGSGLGLALVKWVIEAHNGQVRVESELDQGTVVHIELPLPAPGNKAETTKPARQAQTL